jgi:hypothetical protein
MQKFRSQHHRDIRRRGSRFDNEIKLRQRAATARNDLCVDVLSCEVAALHCDELIFRACMSDLSRCDHGLSIDVVISSTESRTVVI